MSSKRATAEAVASLFTAAGRNYADVELRLYHQALEDISDDELGAAVVAIVRGVDLGERFPSPALIVETVTDARRRRSLARKALPESTDPPIPMSDSAARARALRDRLRGVA